MSPRRHGTTDSFRSSNTKHFALTTSVAVAVTVALATPAAAVPQDPPAASRVETTATQPRAQGVSVRYEPAVDSEMGSQVSSPAPEITATDDTVDLSQVRFSLATDDAGSSIDEKTGVVTVKSLPLGTTKVKVLAEFSDGSIATTEAVFLSSIAANVTVSSADFYLVVGNNGILQPSFSFPSSLPLEERKKLLTGITYNIADGGDWNAVQASLNNTTGAVELTATELMSGKNYSFPVTVIYSDGSTDSLVYPLEIRESGKVITGRDLAYPTYLESAGETVTATPEPLPHFYLHEGISYRLSGEIPPGVSINPTTGVVTWSPSPSDANQYYVAFITIKVIDPDSKNPHPPADLYTYQLPLRVKGHAQAGQNSSDIVDNSKFAKALGLVTVVAAIIAVLRNSAVTSGISSNIFPLLPPQLQQLLRR